MSNNKKQTVLCQLSEIDDLACKSFSVKIKRKETDIFVMRKKKILSVLYMVQNLLLMMDLVLVAPVKV